MADWAALNAVCSQQIVAGVATNTGAVTQA
jgi:hypothetical protein